ncbi:MAG: HIRAN domain-containing protein [Sterolibacterium sp.]|jgi:hypothetical protein
MRLRHIELALLLMLAAVAAQAQTIRILVQSSPLAGFQYHAGAAVWDEMKIGDALALTREPDNPHDGNAVRVGWRGQQLGYLPRAENAAVAAEMDRGGRVEARIARLRNHRNPWQRVLIEVYVVL